MLRVYAGSSRIEFKKKTNAAEPIKSKGIGFADHGHLASQLLERGYDLCSVVVFSESLRPELQSDPRFCRVEHHVEASPLDVKLRQATLSLLPDPRQMGQILKEKKYPILRSNACSPGDPENRKYRHQLEKQVFRAVRMMHFAKLFLEEKLKAEMEERSRGGDFKERVRQRLFSGLLPSIRTEVIRSYDAMPAEFREWDRGAEWQQWYFCEKQERVDYVIGGPGTSTRQDNHGRWAHVFATLAARNYEVPTHVFKYTADNRFQFVRTYETLKVIREHLNTSYAAMELKKGLFENRLLTVENGKIYEVRS